MTHLSAAGFTRSRDAIAGFIKDGMTPADVVGVVVGDKMVGNRIGSDKDALLKALAETKSPNLSRYVEMRTFPRIIDDVEAAKIAKNDERTIANATERACREQPGDCSGAGGDAGVRQQIESKGQRIAAETQRDTSLTLTALESLANGLARLPGPKQVAVFSEGFYTDDTSAWLKNVVGIAARNGVHFSTFDARGIGKNVRSQNFLDAAPVTSSGDLTSLDTDATADVLTSLALDTGGDPRPQLQQLPRAPRQARARDVHLLRDRLSPHQGVRRIVPAPRGEAASAGGGCEGARPPGLRRLAGDVAPRPGGRHRSGLRRRPGRDCSGACGGTRDGTQPAGQPCFEHANRRSRAFGHRSSGDFG